MFLRGRVVDTLMHTMKSEITLVNQIFDYRILLHNCLCLIKICVCSHVTIKQTSEIQAILESGMLVWEPKLWHPKNTFQVFFFQLDFNKKYVEVATSEMA